MAKKKQVVIEQDDREPESLQQLANLAYSNIIFKRKRMKEADYKFGNVFIERKTIDDFCASIIDGRLDKQIKDAQRLKEQGYKYYLFIIGSIKSKTSKINEHCVLGKMCSIVYKHEISVLCMDDEFQFIYCLKNLYGKEFGK